MSEELEEGFEWVRWVYAGRRWNGQHLVDEWIPLEGNDLATDSHRYKHSRGENYVIGGIYRIPVNDKFSGKFHMSEYEDKFDDSDMCMRWAAEDSGASIKRGAVAAEKAAKKESANISEMTLADARRFILAGGVHRSARLAVILKELGQ